jgi:hypothetical protein
MVDRESYIETDPARFQAKHEIIIGLINAY